MTQLHERIGEPGGN